MRYLPQTKKNREEMLAAVGVKSVRELYRDVPQKAFIDGLAKIPMHKGELEIEQILSGYANENHAAGEGPFFLGAGCYNHHVPASVDYIIQRSEFLTAYTPYQPEIAQGTLTAVFEFQTFIAQLTGQDIANASMYDGATAGVEAVLMAMRITGRHKVSIGNEIHPHYRDVIDSYMKNHPDVSIVKGKPDGECACVVLQSPDFFGKPHAYEEWRKVCDETGAMLIVIVNEIVSLGMLPAPSLADIVCGEAQSIGVAMSFGGPHIGFFACKEQYLRQMPGRLVGQTVDADGKRGFVLTLNTREQHIRREKATSNICTNQGLMALAFTVHMSLLGEGGFKQLAQLNHEKACELADAVSKVKGVKVENDNFFNEFVVTLPVPAVDAVDFMADEGIIAGLALDGNRLLMAATEVTSDEDIKILCWALGELNEGADE